MSQPQAVPRALLDANVLWSPVVRDTLLRAAEYGLILPLWSRDILAELVRTILTKRPEARAENLTRTIARMQSAFPNSTVDGYATLIPQLTNHPGDRHVLAAAIRGNAEVIVTWNGRHFLPAAEALHGIAVSTPDTLLCQLWERHKALVSTLLIEQGAGLHPPKSLATTLQSLRRSGASDFADRVDVEMHGGTTSSA